MSSFPNSEPTLSDISNQISALDKRVGNLEDKVGSLGGKVDSLEKEFNQGQKWEDRTWDVIKWVGGISAGLSISAAIALVGLVLKSAVFGQ